MIIVNGVTRFVGEIDAFQIRAKLHYICHGFDHFAKWWAVRLLNDNLDCFEPLEELTPMRHQIVVKIEVIHDQKVGNQLE